MFPFTKSEKIAPVETVDVRPYLRSLCNLTMPYETTEIERRSDRRYNRTILTLLGPWQNDRPLVDQCTIAVTSDIADYGVRLLLNQPFRADTVVVGYWIASDEMSEPWFFLGNVHRNQAIGGGFWEAGIELTGFANTNYAEALAVLKPLAAKLLPPAQPETAEA